MEIQENVQVGLKEGGVTAPRVWVLGIAPKVWEGSQGFGVKCRNLSELLWKSLKKGILKPNPFFTVFDQNLRKKSQILVQLACGDQIVFKSKLPINYAQNSKKVDAHIQNYECCVAFLWLALDHICILTDKNKKLCAIKLKLWDNSDI